MDIPVALRRERLSRAINSRYWRLSGEELKTLVKRRIGPVGVEETAKIDLIGVLLHQDKKETIRHMPARASERQARREEVHAARQHNTTAAIPAIKLSPELRNEIYELAVLRSEPVINTTQHRLAFCPEHPAHSGRHLPISTIGCGSIEAHLEPALLRTCKLFRDEARQMYYARQGFAYDSSRSNRESDGLRAELTRLTEWLVGFGEKLPLLRRVEIAVGIQLPSSLGKVKLRVVEGEGRTEVRGYVRWMEDEEGREMATERGRSVVSAVKDMMPWIAFGDPVLMQGGEEVHTG
ncbi:hypothetical protein Tdes44962_MAKER07114 [Teratosphaeria destructans]|uniref:Uncharacterized protein n=1 Tax=Teratosphaeria destructans TaxID=418781 RepID=A0A9W7SZZ5_9PEZI|nr:hypothetical protein Tdes44962_MAKER07114 [Teratosphaeria destructans]